jgi:hypothetical protein
MSEIASAKIKVEVFLMKQGNRVGKAAIEFTDGPLAGFNMVGFTICDDGEKGIYVLFPAAIAGNKEKGESTRPYFFLRPNNPSDLDRLQTDILDLYDSIKNQQGKFNSPRLRPNGVGLPVAPTVN